MTKCIDIAGGQLSWPLANEQAGLWFMQESQPRLGAFNLLFSLKVCNRQASWPDFQSLLTDLVSDYPVLRSCFEQRSDGITQMVRDQMSFDIRHSDAFGLDDAVLRERARQDARLPFDLREPPLWRLHVYRCDDDSWLVMFVVHHILLDFWSLGLLLKEVFARLGQQQRTLDVQAGIDFAEYARQVLEPFRLSALEAYWAQRFATAPALHEIPLDKPRPSQRMFAGASETFVFDRASSAGITRLAREHHATPFMVMLAAYSAFLGYWSGQEQVVISTPVANRMARRWRDTLGQFVNTLCLPVAVDPHCSFLTLLAQVREHVVGALRHQDMPLHKLVETLAPTRDGSYAALAQLGFSWERLPVLADFEHFYASSPATNEGIQATDSPLTQWQLTAFPVPQQEGQLDLQLEMGALVDECFEAVFKYDSQLFEAQSIRRLRDGLRVFVARLVDAPGLTITQLLQPRADQLDNWRALGVGVTDASVQPGLLDCLSRWAEQQPGSMAVSDAYTRLSYAELWQRSEHLARHLQAHGVGPGDRVGFRLSRGAQLVPVILAIWRLGAAYVPLDPQFPEDRLIYMAEDAGVRLIISDHGVEAPGACPPWISLDRFEATPAEGDLPALKAASGSAYILYTSGSTGKPKGVQVGHVALLNFLLGMHNLFALEPGNCLLAVTTPSFDISLLELFLPLLVGASVHVASQEQVRDGALLASAIEEHAITHLQATPATWQMLLGQAETSKLEGVTALCGGDVLPESLADRLLASCAACWNLYGPTETTVWSSAARLRVGHPPTIGRAIRNTELLVVDEHGVPVPPGMAGELWISGAGLAEGYWGRPDLTAERFIEEGPFGQRWYRTGDRVRWNPHGELEHLGRLDFQVKLRGYRIELGEVEAALCACAGVAQAAVCLKETPQGPALVAYLVAQLGHEPRVEDLKQSLKRMLAAYMVPGHYVYLERLPMTANGKVDRQRMPAPVLDQQLTPLIAPRDELERQLAALFCQTLRHHAISIDDDFFALGGHSLLAVELINQINRSQQAELTVGDLLSYPTVAEMAARLREYRPLLESNLVTLRKGTGRPVWLFHPIGGNVVSYRELSRHLQTPRPVIAVQSPGLGADGEAEVTIEAMATRYIVQLRGVQPQGPYLLGGWCFGGAIAYEVSRQLQAAGETVEGVFLIDTRAPVIANMPADADDATLMSWFARDLAAPHGVRLYIDPAELRLHPAETAFAYLLERARRAGALSPEADAQQLARLFETYLANGIALQLYLPPATQGRFLLLLAQDETEDFGPCLGWEPLLGDGLHTEALSGDHNSIMYVPQVQAVAERVSQYFNLSLCVEHTA
ncbi:amino acid adenylation domain-containing protein [Pseudomonas sp. NPDC089743]|uniref:non-ribosomal peptide synthetase n=1 Tax=Pseudomonas sp. NPDC089743 TaxID=3364471 RepID=UPI00380ED8D8